MDRPAAQELRRALNIGCGTARPVTAPRGTRLACRGWQQEAALRMLCNNLDPANAEDPDRLVVYGGTGRAARSWPCFDASVDCLLELADDETRLVQSGKPVGVLRTHRMSPRVLIANSNLVPRWADWEHFRDLEARGLMMYGQMTAGSWIYIGTQGILQGTFETFAELARRHFGGSLRGRVVLTAGLGGRGGAQPLAVTMNDGVCVAIEVDEARARRRHEIGYVDAVTDDPDEALAQARRAEAERRKAEAAEKAHAREEAKARADAERSLARVRARVARARDQLRAAEARAEDARAALQEAEAAERRLAEAEAARR